MEKSKQAIILLVLLTILTVLTIDAVIFQHVPTFMILVYGAYASLLILISPRYHKVIKINICRGEKCL